MIKVEPFKAGESRYYDLDVASPQANNDLDVDFHQPNNRPARVYVTYLGGWYQVEVRAGYMVQLRIEHERLAVIGQLLELAANSGTILVGLRTKIVEFASSLRLSYRGLEDVKACPSLNWDMRFAELGHCQEGGVKLHDSPSLVSVVEWGMTGVLWSPALLPIRLCERCEPPRRKSLHRGGSDSDSPVRHPASCCAMWSSCASGILDDEGDSPTNPGKRRCPTCGWWSEFDAAECDQCRSEACGPIDPIDPLTLAQPGKRS